MYLAASGLSCSIQDPCCVTRDLSLHCADTLVVARGLSCSMACGILVPQPGVKPASLALQSGLLTTVSPGKTQSYIS